MAKITRRLDVIIGTQTKQFERGFGRINKRLTGTSRLLKSFGGTMLAMFSAQALISGIKGLVASISGFELAMSKVTAISGATASQFSALKSNALELGRVSEFTATQIGGMQVALARLGFTTPQILKSTDAIRKLATAAGSELDLAAETVAGTLKSFNLAAGESGRVSNTMAESFASSGLTMEKFQSAMANVGVIADISNVTLERTTAIIGTLIDRNIDASKAGTDLRKIFIELKRSGMSWAEAMFEVRSAIDPAKRAVELFGVRAAAAAVIIAQNEGGVDKLTEKYKDNNKELNVMVGIMQDNLHTDLKLLGSAFDGLIQSAGEKGLTGVFRGLIQSMTSFLGGTNDISEGIKKEQQALNSLVTVLLNAANGTDLRASAIEKIKAKYPDFLRGLSLEAATNEEISTGLEEQNKQYKEKLLLQEQDEKHAALSAEKNRLLQEQLSLSEKLADLGEAQYRSSRTKGLSSEHELKATNRALQETQTELQRVNSELEAMAAKWIAVAAATSMALPKVTGLDRFTGLTEKGRNQQMAGLMPGHEYNEKPFFLTPESLQTPEPLADVGPLAHLGSALSEIPAQMEAVETSFQSMIGDVAPQLNEAFNMIATAGIADLANAIGTLIGSNASVGTWARTLVKIFLDMGQQIGVIMIGLGAGFIGLKDAFRSPATAGPALLAAGILLVGATAAIKATLGAHSKGGEAPSGKDFLPRRSDHAQTIIQPIKVFEGNDLLLYFEEQRHRDSLING